MKSTQRLDKILSNMGFGSRSEIRRWAKEGIITVNQKVIKDSGLQVKPEEDEICVKGERVRYQEFIYIMLNKPQGVISATEDSHDRTVIDLLEERYKIFSPFPVGRLDKDTEGLLLLTNDGVLAHHLLSPKKHVDKTYYVEVRLELSEENVTHFNQGVDIGEGYVTMPSKLQIIDSRKCAEVTIMEGKFHQVKRMFKAVGNEVVYLKRIRMGSLMLDESLSLGQYRELHEDELQKLKTGILQPF